MNSESSDIAQVGQFILASSRGFVDYQPVNKLTLCFLFLWKTAYNTGTRTKVTKVEKDNPPITAKAIGFQISDPSPWLIANGNIASSVN